MKVSDKIVNHIKEVYGFELVSPSIPRNEFQRLKRNFYLFILSSVSEKLFYFLRDKVSPIKFKLERPDGEIWMRKRFSVESGSLCEIEIRPIPPEAAIYVTDDKGIYTPDHKDNYKINIWYPINGYWPSYKEKTGEAKTFPINSKRLDECIDAHFSELPQLRESLRDYKLKKLFNE